jgi:hypothetical protein
MVAAHNPEVVDLFDEFYSDYYDAEIREFARAYPERRSLYIQFDDVLSYDPNLADDWLAQPRALADYAEEALRLYELPGAVELEEVNVRLTGLPESKSPIAVSSEYIEMLVAVEGRVVEAGGVETRLREGAFTCQRCGTLTRIPQSVQGGLEEPIQCMGCELEGPFEVDQNQSEFGEFQVGVIEDVPSVLDQETPRRMEVILEGDVAGELCVGDVVVVTGVVDSRQVDGQVFDFSVDAVAVEAAESSGVERWREEYLGTTVDSEDTGGGDEDAFSVFVERSREVIQQGGNLDEDNTKAKIITPFVHALGWNVFDNSVVELEYPRQDSEFEDRVDYALFDGAEHPRVVVEAKQVDAFLDGFTGQVKRYMRLFGAEYGVLTNGERYMVYRQTESESPDETLVVDCSLEELVGQDVVSTLSR